MGKHQSFFLHLLFLSNQLKINIPKDKTLVPFKDKWINSDCAYALC